MTYNHIQTERIGAVGRITLNRPDARNAQSLPLLDELDDAFERFENDAAVNVIVLAANGPHFSAGHDLREAAARTFDFTVEARWIMEEKKYFRYCMRMRDCPKATIALVQGGCIAAGFMVANMCDLVIAGESAYFSDPVVHTLGAASVEVLIHPWVMNLRKAKEMLFTGERMSAQDALLAGLVNKVVPDAELGDAGMAMAQRIAKAPATAIMLTKRSLNRTQDMQGLPMALNAHFDTHQLSHRSEAYLEIKRTTGLDAALKKKAAA